MPGVTAHSLPLSAHYLNEYKRHSVVEDGADGDEDQEQQWHVKISHFC